MNEILATTNTTSTQLTQSLYFSLYHFSCITPISRRLSTLTYVSVSQFDI